MTEIKLKPLREEWREEYVPRRHSKYASGFDLHACFDKEQATFWVEETDDGVPSIWIKPGEYKAIPCGFAMELPRDWEAQVRPRSGLAWRHGVTVLNSPGTIDSDYRGEVVVLLINHGRDSVVIKQGDRIAQMVLQRTIHRDNVNIYFETTDYLQPSERGEKGFGSTG